MSFFIIDASIAAKWFINEEYSDEALSLLQKGSQLHSPDFFLLEMDSIISKWVRRTSISNEEAFELRNALKQYPISYHPFTLLLDTAFSISLETGQSIYDCTYVCLAAALKGRMVTADGRLSEALKSSRYKDYILWIGDLP